MTLLKWILLVAALPMGLLFVPAYFIEEVRLAVEDYIPEVMFPPIGLFLFFVFGATIGQFLGLLFVPEAVLNEPGNRSDLMEALGMNGAKAVRSYCIIALGLCLIAIVIIIEKAYG